MLRFIMTEYEGKLIDWLQQKLLEHANQIDRAIEIIPHFVQKYWKVDDSYEVFFKVRSEKAISFLAFTNLFPLKWAISSNADWCKSDQPDKIFLHESIRFVQVYDWSSEDEETRSLRHVIFERKLNLFYQYHESQSKYLNMLASFLQAEIGEEINSEIIEKILNVKDEEFLGFSLKRIDDNFHLNYLFLKEKDLVLSVDQLTQLIKKWQELTAKKVSRIFISDRNGTIEIAEE